MTARSNAEWQAWGELDPFFGVASWQDRGTGGARPWTSDEFYALGESDWADFLEQWRSYGVTPGICVEIGAGAARLTRPMATYFSHVHGIDISPGMFKVAEPAVAGLPVTLHLSDGHAIPLESESADAVFSTHVFQHLDQAADAEANWREISRVLRPGGTFLVHIPVHQWPGGFSTLQNYYQARRKFGDWRAQIQRTRMARGKRLPIMRGQSYAWEYLEAFLVSCGFVDIELRFFRVRINDGQHSIVLGRVPAAPDR